MTAIRDLATAWRRHPLALAVAASLALHGAALAGAHFLLRGETPTPLRARTVALVVIERAAPVPEAQSAAPPPKPILHPTPAKLPSLAEKKWAEDKRAETTQAAVRPDASPAARPVRAPVPPPKPITPDPTRGRAVGAPPVVKPPPRRPPRHAEAAAITPPVSSPPLAASAPAGAAAASHAERRASHDAANLKKGGAAAAAPAEVPSVAPVLPRLTDRDPAQPPAEAIVAAAKLARPPMPPRYGIKGLANPHPRYPWLSRQRGEHGRVVLRVAVDERGRAADVAVVASSGFGRLDRAAVAALRQWRFAPARRAGRAVAGAVEVPVTFKLSDE